MTNIPSPATPHRIQNPKWPPGGPKIAKGVWKGVYLLVFGCSKLLNKFFDPNTPSMRKGRDGGGETGKKWGKNGDKKKKKNCIGALPWVVGTFKCYPLHNSHLF